MGLDLIRTIEIPRTEGRKLISDCWLFLREKEITRSVRFPESVLLATMAVTGNHKQFEKSLAIVPEGLDIVR